MKKHLCLLMLIAALVVPWASRAQAITLGDYAFTTGVDATKWVSMTGATQILTPSGSDGLASSVQSIGFSFPFGSTNYTQYSVNTDGNLRLGSTVTGTSYYTTPFSTTNCGYNQPKINAFGCDGYGLSGSHYVKAKQHVTDDDDTLLAVEFCMGTYTSTTRDYLYKWQVHLYKNGNIEIVFPAASGIPSTAPAVSHQCGMCVSASDGWIISSATNTAEHFTNGSSETNASGTWFGANRYYAFIHPSNLSCPGPLALTVSNITTDSAIVTWSPGGTETEWVYSLNGADWEYVYDTAIVFDTLRGNTPYTVSVRGVCGYDDTSYASSISFRTACAGITLADLPYSEDFESYGSSSTDPIDPCWRKGTSSTTAYPYPSSTVVNGTRCLYFYGYYPSSTSTTKVYSWAALPPIDDNLDMSDLMLSLKVKRYSSTGTYYTTLLYIGIADDVTGFTSAAAIDTLVTWIDTLDYYSAAASSIHSEEVSFANYQGTGKYVVIYAPIPPLMGSTYCYNYAYVDDVVLRVIPTCFWPTAVTAESVLSDGATIVWTPDSRTANPSSWVVEYDTAGFTRGTGTETTVYDTTVTLTGLDPNTQYDIYVSADCGGDVSDPAFFTFRTACGALTTLPYTENFDNVTGTTSTSAATNNLPPCWNYHNVGTSTSYSGYPIVYNSSSYAHSGSQSMRFYTYITSGTYADQIAIMPLTDSTLYPLSNLQVGFWMRANSTSYNSWVVVGVMTDPTNASTFVPVQTVYTNSSTTYAYHEVSFAAYNGPHGYVTFKFPQPTSGYNYGYVDDVTIREIPTCFWPSAVSLQTVGSETATVVWTPDSRTPNPSSWEVEYGLHGFTRGNGTTETVTTTSISLTNLTPNTEYDIYISADCGGDMSDPANFTFRTECVGLTTLPYTQDFESATTGTSTSAAFVNCMHRLNNGTTYFGYPYVSTTSGYNHTPGGSKGIYWYLTTTTGTYGDYEYVVMPGVDVDQYPMNTLQVRFWARATGTSYSPVFQVGVMTNPTDVNTFQLVETVNVGYGNTTYTEFTVAFGNYSGQGQYIAIRALRPSSSWYATMDDITIEEMPSCPAITDLDATVTVGAAMLTWDYQAGFDAPASYEVTYDSIGGTNPTTVTATDANALLTGLSANTTYKAYVRADCGSDGFGRMDSITFTTEAFQCNEMLIDTTQTLTVNFSTSSSGISGCIAYSSWGNTAYQTVYTAAELAAAGLTPGAIIGIDLGFTGCTTYAKEFSIYIKSTTTSSISNATMEAPGTLVYGPANHPMNTSGWQHYNFTTPFEWDGTSNIMITTFMNQPTGASHTNSTGLTGYYVSATNKARYRYQDNTQWTTSNLTSGNAGSTYSYRAAIHFRTYGGTCIDMATCAEPVLMVADKTASSVTLAWVPGAEETAWDIAYREQGTTTWTTAATGVTTTTYTVTNLSSGTDYDFRLSFDCPADSATYTDIVSTRTPCTAISIPYTYGFENMVAGSTTIRPDIPCWSHLNNGSTYFGYPYGSTTTPHSGMTNLYWYLTTTTGTYGDYMAVVLPPVDTAINPINTLQFTFWARPSSTSYAPVFLVGVMTDPDDINTFETVSTVNVPSGSTDWSFHEVSLNSYHGNGKYVALRANRPSSSWYAYTDDITLETLPTCPHVTNLHATQTGPDSIMLAWTPGGTEVEWEVSYGDTSVIVLTNSYLAENLSPSSMYTFSVRAICTAGDTSNAWEYTTRTACGALTRLPYVQDFEHEATTSSSSTTFVPCWGHYNNGTSSPGYPYLSATASYNHTPGGSKGLYWYGSTTTGTYGDYYIISLPPVDTTVYPVNTLQLTFWARPTSTSYSPVFYVGVLPENATTNQLADSLFQYCDTIMIDHSTDAYKKYTAFLDNFTGTGNRIAIRANRPSSAWYATMDDITLDVIPACAAVEDVTVVSSPASAIVSWTVMGRNYSGATVEYRDTTTSTWTTVTVSGASHAVLTGLTPSMPYTVRVTAICPEGPSATVTAQFSTINFACTAVDTTTTATGTLGTGTAQTSGVPVYSGWGNTLCQSIYLASELQDLGLSSTITSITYTWTVNSTYAKHLSIYMTNTTATEFTGTSTTNWQPTGAATLVYSGPHPVGTSGSVTYQLTTPFEWDGSSNICVTTTMNQPTGVSHTSSGFYGLSTQTAAYRSLYKYQDSNPIDGSNPASVTPSGRSQYRPNVTFTSYGCAQHTTCAAPIAHLANIDATTATVVWAPGNLDTAWNIYYRVYGDTAYTQVATATTARSYTFTGLASGSMYEFMVENTCGSGYTATVSGSTDCVPIAVLPYTETFDNWGSGTGVLPNCWDRTGTYSTYTYLSPTRNHGHGAGASVYMYESTGTSQSWLILPAIDTSLYMANQLQVAFYATYTQPTYGAPTFAVGVMTDPTDVNTFVPIDTVTHTSGYNHWDCFEVPLASYTDSGAYIAIRTLPVTTTTYPYIDDVTIELIPTCMRPDSLYAANATTSSVDVGWRDRANASQWIVEYGPVGFTPGTGAGTTLVANTNPVTISGLPVAYVGEFYVKAVCGNGDTGYFSREAYGINTLQIPATVPYFYDFEDATEWGNWQTSSNSHTNNWFRGSAVADSSNYSIYVSADAGATYKPYIHDAVVNAAAYRDVNFGNVDTSFTISFRARVGGTIEQNYDGLMVFLIDPSLSTVPSNINITSPWGNVNDLYRITTVRRDTVWDTYTASFDTISGVKRVAFFWFNQNTQSYTNLGEPAAVDNLSITYSSCPRPLELDTVSVNGTTVMLTWDGDATGTYQITYRPVGGANRSTIVTGNQAVLSNLNALTTYNAWVRKICGVGDTSLYSDGISFATGFCTNAYMVRTDADSTVTFGTSYYAPVDNYYNYTLTETIIDSAELGGARELSSLAYYYSYTSASTAKTNVDIWIQPTNKSVFSSSSDMVALDTTIAVRVYHGNLNCSNGWNYFGFSTPYNYNGRGNLLVIVDDNSGDYDGLDYVFNTVPSTGYKTIIYYSDSDNPVATSPTSFSGSKTYYQWRPRMLFVSCGEGCATPGVTVTDITHASATLTAIGNGLDYELAYGTDPDNLGTPQSSTTGVFNLTGLANNTEYFYEMRQQCESGNWSSAYSGSFNTANLPCTAPSNLSTTNVTYTGATLTWTPGNRQTTWEVHLFAGSTVNRYDTVTNPTFTYTDLVEGTTYNMAVRGFCTETEYSDWSDTLEVTTQSCVQVTDITVSNITATGATLSWPATGAESYTVEYGYQGMSQGDGVSVTVNTNSCVLTDLDRNTHYDAYVRGNCSGVAGVWSAVVSFTTTSGGQGILDADVDQAVVVYPNPASELVTITAPAASTVTLVDLNGRQSGSWYTEDGSLTIDVSDLAKGAYFVRVTTAEGTAVRKLIVK